MWTKSFQMSKMGLEKEEELEIKLPTFCCIIEKARELQKNIYLCFIKYTKTFDCVDHDKLWKALKERDGNTRPSYLSPEKPLCRSRCNS